MKWLINKNAVKKITVNYSYEYQIFMCYPLWCN